MSDMYICLCNAVKQSEIEKAINEGGLTTLSELEECLEVAVNCGMCRAQVLGILCSELKPRDL